MDQTNLSWWNLLPQHTDNTLITLFSREGFLALGSVADGSGFPIRFYGLMYLASFFSCYYLMKYFIKKEKLPITDHNMDGLLSWIIGGILLGGRLGYVLFYNLPYYLSHPLEILLPFKFGNKGMEFVGISGMSYHGGMLGAFIAGLIFTKREKINTWLVVNLGFLCAPIGYTWGRLGNFLNGELYGRPTDSAWGMLFPADMTQLRHPSQVYEMVFEGPVLFAIQILLWRSKKMREHMFSTYLMGYGVARFFIEYVREPDAHIGLQAGFSRGQYLCLAMILGGIAVMFWRQKQLNAKQV